MSKWQTVNEMLNTTTPRCTGTKLIRVQRCNERYRCRRS